jgi:hypothetical protein
VEGKNGTLLLLKGPGLEKNPSPPSICYIVGEYINFIANLKSRKVASNSLQSVALWLTTTIQLMLHLV